MGADNSPSRAAAEDSGDEDGLADMANQLAIATPVFGGVVATPAFPGAGAIVTIAPAPALQMTTVVSVQF